MTSKKPSSSHDLITIGITTFNAQDTINEAIESALQQNWPQFEIVIVDDCSTDETTKIINEFEKSYEHIRSFVHTQNLGVAAARNRIIQEAQGLFIAFFDDDDVSDPARISEQYRRIAAYEQKFGTDTPLLCHCARLQIYPDDKQVLAQTAGCIQDAQKIPGGENMLARLLWGQPVKNGMGAMATCSQMARKSVYEDLKGFDESFKRSEDTELTIRHASNAGAFIGISSPLVHQTMTMSVEKNLDDELYFTLLYLDKHQEAFPSKRFYKFQREWVTAKYQAFKGQYLALLLCFIKHPLFSFQKLVWSLPNLVNNFAFKAFYRDE